MNPLLIFTTSFLVAISGALMPGPMLTMTVKESLLYGWRAGVYISTGHGIAEIILIALFALGLNRILQIEWMSAGVGLFGGLVLLLMGVEVIRGSPSGVDIFHGGETSRQTGAASSSLWRPLREGIVLSITNPGWVLWWFSVGIVYVTMAMRWGWIGLGSFFSGHILADFAWYVFIAFAVAAGKKYLGERGYRWILTICGLFLVCLAFYFIAKGVQATIIVFKSL